MPESKPISNFDSARDSAVQGTTDAAVRAVNGVSSAALRSKERSANIVQSGAAFGRTTAAAGGALVATFVDIERMATTLGEHTRTTINEAGRVLPVAGRGDLLESFILSPATGYLAETAVLAAASRLGVHIAMATGLGIVAVTIVSTYQLADTALELGAAGFSFGSTAVVNTVASGIDLGVSAVRATGDFIVAEVSGNVKVLIAGVTTVVAGATIAATLALVLRGALESAIAGFGARSEERRVGKECPV